MCRAVGILIVYSMLATVLIVAGTAIWWRRYHDHPPTRCDFCGRTPAPWTHHDFSDSTDRVAPWHFCGDTRCLEQAEAEAQHRRENR